MCKKQIFEFISLMLISLMNIWSKLCFKRVISLVHIKPISDALCLFHCAEKQDLSRFSQVDFIYSSPSKVPSLLFPLFSFQFCLHFPRRNIQKQKNKFIISTRLYLISSLLLCLINFHRNKKKIHRIMEEGTTTTTTINESNKHLK